MYVDKERILKVAALYLEGKRMDEISKIVGVAASNVSKDLFRLKYVSKILYDMVNQKKKENRSMDARRKAVNG